MYIRQLPPHSSVQEGVRHIHRKAGVSSFMRTVRHFVCILKTKPATLGQKQTTSSSSEPLIRYLDTRKPKKSRWSTMSYLSAECLHAFLDSLADVRHRELRPL